jgi:hypothetical protein
VKAATRDFGMNWKTSVIGVLAALGGVAGLTAPRGGPIDAAMGAAIWAMIGWGIVAFVDYRRRKSQPTVGTGDAQSESTGRHDEQDSSGVGRAASSGGTRRVQRTAVFVAAGIVFLLAVATAAGATKRINDLNHEVDALNGNVRRLDAQSDADDLSSQVDELSQRIDQLESDTSDRMDSLESDLSDLQDAHDQLVDAHNKLVDELNASGR